MADPNNIPQEAEQLKRDINSEDANPDVADTQYDKEYEMAKDNTTGEGTQSSDPNPVNRKPAEAGVGSDRSTPDVSSSAEPGQQAGSQGKDGVSADADNPSNPDNYKDMAKSVTDS